MTSCTIIIARLHVSWAAVIIESSDGTNTDASYWSLPNMMSLALTHRPQRCRHCRHLLDMIGQFLCSEVCWCTSAPSAGKLCKLWRWELNFFDNMLDVCEKQVCMLHNLVCEHCCFPIFLTSLWRWLPTTHTPNHRTGLKPTPAITPQSSVIMTDRSHEDLTVCI